MAHSDGEREWVGGKVGTGFLMGIFFPEDCLGWRTDFEILGICVLHRWNTLLKRNLVGFGMNKYW